MRDLLYIICLSLILTTCTKKEDQDYLKKGAINLAQPRIIFGNSVIDSFVVLTAHFNFKDVAIYYTKDGQDPTLSSFKYHEPIRVTEPGIYKFRSFHPDWKASETTSVEFYKKGLTPVDIIWRSKANQKYKGFG